MKNLILLLFLAFSAFAQTAKFPNAIATNQDLTDLADRAQTTLSAPLNASATSFTVVSGTKFAAHMILTIGNEQIKICQVSSNTITVGHSSCPNVDGRGFAGTAAAGHASGALVSDYFVSYSFKAIREEVKAMQTALGAGMSNIPKATANPVDYDFTAQTPGGSLSVGNNTITLSPCPLGINGNDTNHWLRFANGTGTAESAPILSTGPGTCTSGAASGTITVTNAYTHSGAWTVSSATAGAQEAIQAAATAGGGVVTFPTGSFTIYAGITLPAKVTLKGQGMGATVIQAAANTWGTAPWYRTYSTSCGTEGGYAMIHSGAVADVGLLSLSLDMNGSTQSSNPMNTLVVFFDGTTNSLIRDVEIKNNNQGGSSLNLMCGASNNIVDHVLMSGTGAASGPGGIFVRGGWNTITNSVGTNLSDEYFVANDNAVGNIFTGNHALSPAVTIGAGFHAEGSSGNSFTNNTVSGSNFTFCYAATGVDATFAASNNVFADNYGAACGYGVYIKGIVTAPAVGNTAHHNHLLPAASGFGIAVLDYTQSTKIDGNTIKNAAMGINVNASAVTITGVDIVDNRIDHSAANPGIQIQASGGFTVNNVRITGNSSGDSDGSPSQTYGLVITGLNAPGGYIIKDNIFSGNVTGDYLITQTIAGLLMGPNSTMLAPYGLHGAVVGSTVASGSSITATGEIFHVSGTAAIASIALSGVPTGTKLTLIPDGNFTMTTGGGGNIGRAYSATTGVPVTLTLDAGGLWWPSAATIAATPYPGAGVPLSTGTAWGTSYTVGTGNNNLVQLNGSAQLPAVSAANLTNFPTLNQNTTGTAAGLTAQYIDWSASSGGTSIKNKPSLLLQPCEVIIGDPGAASSALAADNDRPAVCSNIWGANLTITGVACYADAGGPTITPIIHGGGATSILTGALTCGTGSFASGTLNGVPVQTSTDSIDANVTVPGGTAKYIVVRISRTL